MTCFIILGGREDESAMTEIDGSSIGWPRSCCLASDAGGAVKGAVYRLEKQDGVSGLY